MCFFLLARRIHVLNICTLSLINGINWNWSTKLVPPYWIIGTQLKWKPIWIVNEHDRPFQSLHCTTEVDSTIFNNRMYPWRALSGSSNLQVTRILQLMGWCLRLALLFVTMIYPTIKTSKWRQRTRGFINKNVALITLSYNIETWQLC